VVFETDRSDYFKWELDAYHTAPPQFSASDSKGAFLMLLVSDSGRYGNGTYNIGVDLYRVDSMFHREQIFRERFAGRGHQFALDENGFRLETMSMEHDAARAGYRVYPYRYEIQGDHVIRVAPIGLDAHDFVGEWGNLPWEEAANWSDAAQLHKIQEYYKKIRGADGYFGGMFGTTQVCDPQQRIWQVEYTGDDPGGSIYFLVERKDRWTFIVKDIGMENRAGCKNVEGELGRPHMTMFAKPLVW